MKITANLVILIALFASTAQGQSAIEASVTPEKATVGDRLKYEIVIRPDPADRPYIKPVMRLPDPKPFEVISAVSEPLADGAIRLVFTLAVFETGRKQLPVYQLEWIDEKGRRNHMLSEPVFVEIISVLKPSQTAPENLRLEPVASAERDWSAYIPALLAFCLLAGAVLLAARYLRPKPVAVPVRRATPSEDAFAKLDELEREDLYSAGRIKEHFSGVADVLRDYLKAEFGVDAPEKTTWELERIWPEVLAEYKKPVISLLSLCDSAKFARSVLSREDSVRAVKEAREFVSGASRIRAVEAESEKETESARANLPA